MNRVGRRMSVGLMTVVFIITLTLGLGSVTIAGPTITVGAIQDPYFFALEKLIPEFESKTGIKVQFQGLEYNVLHARAMNSFMSRKGTLDVMSVEQMWISQWADNGWLMQLDPHIRRDNDEVDIEDFIPSVIHASSEWKGHLYTLPICQYGIAVLYLPEVFEALGLREPPTNPSEPTDWWTWDKYIEYVEKINGATVNGTKMYGTVICGAQPQPIVHMFVQLAGSMGARWLKSFPESDEWDFTPQMDSPENIRALERYLTLYKNSPPESINYLWFDAGTAFSKGNVGMFYWTTPYAYLVRKAGYMSEEDSPVAGRYQIALLPHEPGQPKLSGLSGYSFGVNNFSDNKESAWEFIKWSTSEETLRKMGLVSPHQFADFPRKSIYERPGDELMELYPWLPTQYDILKGANGKAIRPPISNYFTLEGIYGRNLNRALTGETTVKEALDNVQGEFDAILRNTGFIPWLAESYNDTVASTSMLLKSLAGRN